METLRRIEPYLHVQGVPFHLIPHTPTQTLREASEAAEVDYHQVVRAVMLEDEQGMVMAVLPADHMLDFNALGDQLGRRFQPVPLTRLSGTFPDCEPGSIPPVPQPYGLSAIIDDDVSSLPEVYFEPGSHASLLDMNGNDFMQLHQQSRHLRFSRPVAALADRDTYEFAGTEMPAALKGLHPQVELQQRVHNLAVLPPLPDTARRLLQLRATSTATVADLSGIITADPVLTAQVIRYARSGFFGYRPRVETLQDAISHVLGFDLVLHLALGLSASRALRPPLDGPLGLRALWRHAAHCAGLAQALGTQLPTAARGTPGLLCLAGLLHDIGYAVLGHLFRPEFYLLNNAVAANPDIPVTLIEKRLLGVEHTQLGSWLLKAWEMPEEVVTAAQEHHDEYYSGVHARYANVVLLADHLLKRYQPSDAADIEPPAVVLTAVGLEAEQAMELTRKALLQCSAGLDELARTMAVELHS